MTVSRETFTQGIEDLHLSPSVIDHLIAHWDLVKTWTARTNLTAITDDRQAGWRHYRDSLEVLPFLPASGSVIDIGSGGGFPGVPIAIATSLQVTLLEPRRKRVSFLRLVKSTLSLDNLRIMEGRSTDTPVSHDLAITRATFSNSSDLRACLKWAPTLIAMRSKADAANATHTYEILDSHRAFEIIGGS